MLQEYRKTNLVIPNRIACWSVHMHETSELYVSNDIGYRSPSSVNCLKTCCSWRCALDSRLALNIVPVLFLLNSQIVLIVPVLLILNSQIILTPTTWAGVTLWRSDSLFLTSSTWFQHRVQSTTISNKTEHQVHLYRASKIMDSPTFRIPVPATDIQNVTRLASKLTPWLLRRTI